GGVESRLWGRARGAGGRGRAGTRLPGFAWTVRGRGPPGGDVRADRPAAGDRARPGSPAHGGARPRAARCGRRRGDRDPEHPLLGPPALFEAVLGGVPYSPSFPPVQRPFASGAPPERGALRDARGPAAQPQLLDPVAAPSSGGDRGPGMGSFPAPASSAFPAAGRLLG